MVMSKYCKNQDPCDQDYWCKNCNIFFCSCSTEGEDHDNNTANVGHRVYDAKYTDEGVVYVVGKAINPLKEVEPKPKVGIYFYYNRLIKMLVDNDIPAPTIVDLGEDSSASFSIEGPRDSIVIYRIWGGGVVNVWFGKANDDSGGLARQGSLDHCDGQLKEIIKLHKRFFKSGRRKILRNAGRH